MESRFILGQQALTPDGAVYQIIWDEPYNEIVTPNIVVNGLITRAPENTVAGSTCIFNTEDADGYPVEWLFAYDGTDWALDRVVRGGSAGGDGAVIPTITMLTPPTSSARGTYSSDMSFDDMVSAIRNSAFIDRKKQPVIPIWFVVQGAGGIASAISEVVGSIEITVGSNSLALYADGTIGTGGMS